jgi:NAD(P)-dependent dehydrogenase (short-subunit alcohol dehydrogenase family)
MNGTTAPGAGADGRSRRDDEVTRVTGASAGRRADDRGRRAALVTGASSGIGFAIAHMLRQESFDVTISSSSEKIHAAARELAGTHAVQGDVALEPDCQRIVDEHLERFGRLDVLVNSAGVLHHGRFEDLPLSDWNRMFAVNVTGTFLMTKLALTALRTARGLIVNLASIAGKEANAGLAAYGATKAAVISLTKSLNAEVAADGVRALAICPGFVDTPMASISSLDGKQMIQPTDVAEVVLMALRLGATARVPEVLIEIT